MKPWGKKKQQVVKEIAALVNKHSERENFVRATRRKYKSKFLGEGAARAVFSLPHGLVVKVQAGWSEQNETEYNMYQRYPKLVCPVLVFLNRTGGVYNYSVIVAQRARILRRVPKEPKRNKQYRKLCGLFEDVFPTNVGVLKGKLVLTDGGCGAGYTSYYSGNGTW